MASIIEELEKAIYSKCQADTGAGGLMTLVGYAGPFPASATSALPRLTFELQGTPVIQQTLGQTGWWEFRYRFTAWTSQEGGSAGDPGRGQAIISRIIALFDRVALTISGYTHIATLVESAYGQEIRASQGTIDFGIKADFIIWAR